MAERLKGKRIAIIATDMVERVELVEPRAVLDEAGARTELISLKPGSIQSVNHHDKADSLRVDVTIGDADPGVYDGLLIPGGVANPDVLRRTRTSSDSCASFSRLASRSRRSATGRGSSSRLTLSTTGC